MNIAEKKEAWRLLGQGIDDAGLAGVPAAEFLTRAALLFALELPDLAQVSALIEIAHAAGAAGAAEEARMTSVLEQAQ